MVDLSELIEESERKKVETMAADFDFEDLKRINRDSDGSSLNPKLDFFIDWAAALLRRIPKNWEDYLVQTPADLKTLFDETTELLQRTKNGASQAVGARSALLNAMSSNIQSVMSRQINSVPSLVLLQMIGDDRSSATGQRRERFEKALAEAEKKQEAAAASAQALQEMVDASKEATAKVAASGRARVFYNEGKAYEEAAYKWLIATAALGPFAGISDYLRLRLVPAYRSNCKASRNRILTFRQGFDPTHTRRWRHFRRQTIQREPTQRCSELASQQCFANLSGNAAS